MIIVIHKFKVKFKVNEMLCELENIFGIKFIKFKIIIILKILLNIKFFDFDLLLMILLNKLKLL